MASDMIEVPGYNLYSFTVGCKHVRTFTITDMVGTVADCILGECGAEGSPIPANYFDNVSINPEGVEVIRKKGEGKAIVTREKVVVGSRTGTQTLRDAAAALLMQWFLHGGG